MTSMPSSEADEDGFVDDTPDGLLCYTGSFPSIFIADPHSLEPLFSITTGSGLRGTNNQFVRLVDLNSDVFASSDIVIAVAQETEPYNTRIYDILQRRLLASLPRHQNQVWAISALPSQLSFGPRVISGGWRSQAFVFDVENTSFLAALPNPPTHTYRIENVPEWSNSEVFVAGSGNSNVLFLYDLNALPSPSSKLLSFSGHSGTVTGIAWDVNRDAVFSTGYDTTVRMWSRKTARQTSSTITMPLLGFSCTYIEERNLLYVGTLKEKIYAYDPRKLTQAAAVVLSPCESKGVRRITAVSRNVCFSAHMRSIAKWNSKDGSLMGQIEIPRNGADVKILSQNENELYLRRLESERIGFVFLLERRDEDESLRWFFVVLRFENASHQLLVPKCYLGGFV